MRRNITELPSPTINLSIRIDPEQSAAVRTYAAARQVSISTAIREFIDIALAAKAQEEVHV